MSIPGEYTHCVPGIESNRRIGLTSASASAVALSVATTTQQSCLAVLPEAGPEFRPGLCPVEAA